MFSYTPKLADAAGTTFVLVILIALGGNQRIAQNERLMLALNIGAAVMALITAIILALLVLEAVNQRVVVMTDFMREFAKLDEEGRAAMAFTFPTMRYRMAKGKVREMFEDTNVSIDTFRLFLQTSNEKSISPERDWSTKEKPRRDWLEIKEWLEGQGYILEDSYAGNHSWLWRGNSYRHLMAYWMAGRRVENMNIGTEAVYQE